MRVLSFGAPCVPGIPPWARMPVLRLGPVVAAFALLTACGAREAARSASAAAPRDDFGDTIVIGPRPGRIVSLSPATTEILFAIGAGPRLVGRTRWDLWPDSARLVPDLGDGLRPNVEAVLGAHPDLVVLYASADNRAAAARLRQAGVRVAAFRIDRLDDFRRDTRLLGRIAGDSLRADSVVDSVSATLERVRTATAALPHPTVIFEMNERPVITIGGGSFLNDLVTIAGARNAYAALAAPSPIVTLEDVVHRDPDYVLAAPEAVPRLLADPAWNAVRAVRERRVLAYDTNLVTRPAVRLGEAAVSLARLLHPAGVPGLPR